MNLKCCISKPDKKLRMNPKNRNARTPILPRQAKKGYVHFLDGPYNDLLFCHKIFNNTYCLKISTTILNTSHKSQLALLILV